MTDSATLDAPLSLDKLIQQSITSALQSGSLAEKVQRAADKAIEEAISNAFGYSSEFRKKLQKSIETILPDVDVDQLATFAHATRQVLQKRLANAAHETATAHLNHVLEELLPDAPVITINELKDAFIAKLKDSMDDGCSCHDISEDDLEFTWDIHESRSSDGYWDLTISPKSGGSSYSKEAIFLRFRAKGDLQECWNATIRESEISVGSLFNGPLFGFDAMIFRLGTGTAKLKK